jgi:beta-glucosidase
MNKTAILASLIIAGSTSFLQAVPSENQADKAAKRAHDLVSQMTLDEKLDMIHGDGFNIAPVKRLGISAVNMSDASMGLRITPLPHSKGLEPSTAFPASILLAASWNPDIAYIYAKSVSEEFRARSMHVLLGPGVNIYRSPLCGRNYEYMGEDPYLTASMAVPYVKGVRDVGCIPTVKHLVANNSEPRRKQANSVVSERALREIYFPAFKAAVKQGRALGIMNAYNLVNGVYCGENSWLLKDVLRDEWGFTGMVVSDWTSIWNTELAANSGLDIEMPGGKNVSALSPDKMKMLLKEGKLTQAEIDSKVFNLIRPCLEMGVYSADWTRPELNKRDEHAAVALQTAREGMMLLKNNDLLPLAPEKVKKIVVIGPTAEKTPTTGGGSGGVWAEHPISIWDGISAIYGDKAELLQTFNAEKIKGADAVIVCVGYNTGLQLNDPRKKKSAKSIEDEQDAFNNSGRSKKKWALDTSEHEGADRKGFSLPKQDNKLIEQCAESNPAVAVLYVAGGGIAMPWKNKVKSILWMCYPGQNGSTAAAEIVAGKINPSGKLPITIEKQLKDNAAFGRFNLSWNAGRNGQKKKAGIRKYWDIPYSEGIFVGYRHMDKEGIEPQFCFGHGLSYTEFKYSNLKVTNNNGKVSVSFDLTNTGKYSGAEVAQLYVADLQCSFPRPPKELKGFKKVSLVPGETGHINLVLDDSSFSYWNPKSGKWTVEPGKFDILIGSSSRDIRLKGSIEL